MKLMKRNSKECKFYIAGLSPIIHLYRGCCGASALGCRFKKVFLLSQLLYQSRPLRQKDLMQLQYQATRHSQ